MSTGTPQADLAGSVTLVTGGGRGVGRVLALALAGAGAKVGLIARSPDQLAESVRLIEAAGGAAAAACADLSDPAGAAAAVDKLRRELGPVDLLVNNAGVTGPIGPAWKVSEPDWWHAVEINLRGVTLCSRLVLPEMVARRRGRIVNLTSQAGAFRWPMVSAYSVSKAAVIKLTENLSYETRRYGIGVFSVHPGILPIGLSEPALASTAPSDSPVGRMREWVGHELAEGRGAQPDQVAGLLLRIATGELDRLSGRHLSVHDDLDAVLARTDDVVRDDLYVLRRRELPG
ncbi:MAG: SDR family oxidoreductase [Pseudonocardiales bacterium]|nr:SDR family oxidoreductase [Pseudonocardiales bacterium]MBV9649089.1 SDR family oxidoreductase [Pseudonocardiales bacterium]